MSKLLVFAEDRGEKLCYRSNGELLSTDELLDLYEESKRIAQVSKDFQEQLKAVVEEKGILRSERLPDLALTIKEREGRPSINAAKAIPIMLNGYFDNDELKDFVTVPMGKMKKALEAKTESGDKKGRVERLLNDLQDAGAIERGRPSRSLVVEAVAP